MRGGHDVEMECLNDECDRITIVHWYPDTEIDPGYPDVDYCVGCGEDLNWDDQEPVDPEEERWANHPDI